MARTYYTLCTFDAAEHGYAAWYDAFGSYKRAEVQEEADSYDIPKTHKRIVQTDGSATRLVAELAKLNASDFTAKFNARGAAKREALAAKLNGGVQ